MALLHPPSRSLAVVAWAAFCASAALGCVAAAPTPDEDGSMSPDAATTDAAQVTAPDAAFDAASSPMDGGMSTADAGTSVGTDAGSVVGLPCVAMGLAGTCQATTSCTGMMMSVPGYCPGPAGIQCCVTSTPSSTCESTDVPLPNVDRMIEPPGSDGCPDGMALVEGFCMDRYEATLAEVSSSGALLPWSPFFNPGSRTMRALSVPDAVPQGYINRTQAEAACTNAGKRLCESVEWLRACQGAAPGTTFPYGNTRVWDVCNDRRSVHPAVEYFGTNASWIYSEIDHSCLNQLPNSLAHTGSHAGCVSDEGIFDLVGNLHEWTLGTPSPGHGVFRGGFYVDTVINGEGCLYRTVAHAPSHWDYSTGFRCCAAAP